MYRSALGRSVKMNGHPPKWESKTTFPEWYDFLLNVTENEKLSGDNHTPIQYLLHKQEASTTTDYLPADISRLEV